VMGSKPAAAKVTGSSLSAQVASSALAVVLIAAVLSATLTTLTFLIDRWFRTRGRS